MKAYSRKVFPQVDKRKRLKVDNVQRVSKAAR